MQEPISVTINEAARLSGYSRSSIEKMIRTGKLKTKKMGDTQQARRLVIYASLKKLLEPKEEAA